MIGRIGVPASSPGCRSVLTIGHAGGVNFRSGAIGPDAAKIVFVLPPVAGTGGARSGEVIGCDDRSFSGVLPDGNRRHTDQIGTERVCVVASLDRLSGSVGTPRELPVKSLAVLRADTSASRPKRGDVAVVFRLVEFDDFPQEAEIGLQCGLGRSLTCTANPRDRDGRDHRQNDDDDNQFDQAESLPAEMSGRSGHALPLSRRAGIDRRSRILFID